MPNWRGVESKSSGPGGWLGGVQNDHRSLHGYRPACADCSLDVAGGNASVKTAEQWAETVRIAAAHSRRELIATIKEIQRDAVDGNEDQAQLDDISHLSGPLTAVVSCANEDQSQLDELSHPTRRRFEQAINIGLLNFLLAVLLFERFMRRVARKLWRGCQRDGFQPDVKQVGGPTLSAGPSSFDGGLPSPTGAPSCGTCDDHAPQRPRFV